MNDTENNNSDALSYKSNSSFEDFSANFQLSSDVDQNLAGDGGWKAFRKYFVSDQELESFEKQQKDLYRDFNDEEKNRQAYLLRYFLKEGKYPRIQLPESDKTIEELLTRNPNPKYFDGIKHFQLGPALYVDSDIIKEFESTWKLVKELDADLAARMLNGLCEGAPKVFSKNRKIDKEGRSITLFQKGDYMETKTLPSQHNLHGNYGRIQVAPTTVAVDSEDNRAILTGPMSVTHETGHNLNAMYFPVDFAIRQATPAGVYDNHEEKYEIDGNERYLLKKQGLVPRKSHHAFDLTVGDFESANHGLRILGDYVFQYTVKEEINITGHVTQYDSYQSMRLEIKPDNSASTSFHVREIEGIIGGNAGDKARGKARGILNSAHNNKDIVSLAKSKGGLPVFNNHSENLRKIVGDSVTIDSAIVTQIGSQLKFREFVESHYDFYQNVDETQKLEHRKLLIEHLEKGEHPLLLPTQMLESLVDTVTHRFQDYVQQDAIKNYLQGLPHTQIESLHNHMSTDEKTFTKALQDGLGAHLNNQTADAVLTVAAKTALTVIVSSQRAGIDLEIVQDYLTPLKSLAKVEFLISLPSERPYAALEEIAKRKAIPHIVPMRGEGII
ncbi:MAG: hypothetical protein V4568_08595 [Pseudomonadota bacterium]